jgi:hypothetical protein
VDISGASVDSKFLLNFKTKYQTSYAVNTLLSFIVKRAPSPFYDGSFTEVFRDTLLGSSNAGAPLIDTYTSNYVDSPNSTDLLRYQLFYKIYDPSGNLGSDEIGILGSSGNSIIIQELLGSGTANLGSTGPSGPPGTDGSGGLLIAYQFKNSGLLSDLSNIRNVVIDANGYNLDITPSRTDSNINVMFRALLMGSEEPYSRLNVFVSYDINNSGTYIPLCSDSLIGYTNKLELVPDPITSIYTLNTIHNPNTTSNVNYKLSYSIEASGVDISTNIPLGILESSANSIILEELNGAGTTATPLWSVGSGNTIYYNNGTVCIGTNVVDTNYILDISGNTNINGNVDISGNVKIDGILDMSCNFIFDVSAISWCDGTYIGPGGSFDISTNDLLKISSNNFSINNSFYQVYQPSKNPPTYYYGFGESNPRRDYVFATEEEDTILALYNKDASQNGNLVFSFRNDISGRDISFIETAAISNELQDSSNSEFQIYNYRNGAINRFLDADGSNNTLDLSANRVIIENDLEIKGGLILDTSHNIDASWNSITNTLTIDAKGNSVGSAYLNVSGGGTLDNNYSFINFPPKGSFVVLIEHGGGGSFTIQGQNNATPGNSIYRGFIEDVSVNTPGSEYILLSIIEGGLIPSYFVNAALFK